MILTTNINKTNKIQDAEGRLFKLKSGETPILSKQARAAYNQELYGYQRYFEYDLAESYKIMDTESLVASAFKKKITLILKEGFTFKSKIPANVTYINKRLSEIEYVTGKKFSDILYDIVQDMVVNHNCFLLQHRSINSSTGLTRDARQPLAALYRLILTQVSPVRNKYKETIAYKYNISDVDYYDVAAKDMYHIHLCKKPGLSIGTPPLEAVRDDILSLRQIEESLERLIYKMASPIIHCKVGSDTKPAGRMADNTPEIDYYNRLLSNMDENGGITTSNRVELKLIGAESQALRMSEYLTHYKNRVLSGLNISEVDLGVGSSTTGGAADLISQALKEDVEMYQKTIANFFTEKFFNDLLLESRRYSGQTIIPDDEYVNFMFNTPSTDVRIREESHLANMVRNNLLTVEKFEEVTGYDAPDYAQELLKLPLLKLSEPSTTNQSLSNTAEPQNQHTAPETKTIKDSINTLLDSPKNSVTLSDFYYLIQDELTGVLEKDTIHEIVTEAYAYFNKFSTSDISKNTLAENITKHILDLVFNSIK
jgi:hypothetical protein